MKTATRRRTRSSGSCSVANGDCVAPAEGGYNGTGRRTWCSCFQCGEPVCSAPCCSRVVVVERGKRRRFCYNCRPEWWPEESDD